MRDVDPILRSKLETFIRRPVDVYFWECFYEFIVLSYSVPSDRRFGVSDLFFELKKYDISETADMIKVYAHGIYLLAKFNNRKIYGDDFNV